MSASKSTRATQERRTGMPRHWWVSTGKILRPPNNRLERSGEALAAQPAR